MFEFEKPNIEINEISEDNRFGRFVVEPLERGYGTTFRKFLKTYHAFFSARCSSKFSKDQRCSA